jgi:6-phosphogluconolactonase/glucosamine-6-phosphate isomerase/deaminase
MSQRINNRLYKAGTYSLLDEQVSSQPDARSSSSYLQPNLRGKVDEHTKIIQNLTKTQSEASELYTKLKKEQARISTIVYLGFMILLLMFGGLMFDYFQMRIQEHKNFIEILELYKK